MLSSKKEFAFGKGKKAKVLLGCGVLAVIWVIWMKRNRTFEVYSGAEIKKFYKRVEFWAYLYWSMFFVGNLKITLFFYFVLNGTAVVV